ncbi:nuclear transport factor 2 family protein [Phenylobacterium sp. LjRoot219]|uniref:nuclear transport factor 2 family protein n=1 Tax=Phenylobacterium sp. LjRoot219 TaxID=3342283 RepID=UPI003ECD1FCD
MTSYADDYAAISQVKARYCRFLDGKDWAAYTDLFTEDFVLDTSPAGGAPPIHGRAAAITYIRGSVEHARTAHQVHSPEIEIDGDVAHVIWAMQDRVIWGPDRAATMSESGHTGYGQYRERYERRDGRWRIAASQLSYLIYEPQPRV